MTHWISKPKLKSDQRVKKVGQHHLPNLAERPTVGKRGKKDPVQIKCWKIADLCYVYTRRYRKSSLKFPGGRGYIFKPFWGRGGGLWERVGLFESGPCLINCKTHYRCQRRGRNRQGYACLLPILDQVNERLIWRFEWKSTWKWTKTVTKTTLKPIDLTPSLYSSSA